MYDELVALLRKKYDKAPMVMEACDAIEELSKQIKSWEEALSKQNENWEEALKNALDSIPCWIPVTEALPEDGSDVLAYLKYEVGGRIAAANYDKGMWQDCVMGGLYRTEEGVVTHWMPLPEPPKEEET